MVGSIYKRVSFRKPPPPISCFPYILVRLHGIFKHFVPTPYNTHIIMGGRDKNFEDPMQSDQDRRKTRYGRRRFSKTHPLSKIYYFQPNKSVYLYDLDLGEIICRIQYFETFFELYITKKYQKL